MGGDTPSLTSKNISTPLERKIRNLKKIWPEGVSKFALFKKFLFFVVFEVNAIGPFFLHSTREIIFAWAIVKCNSNMSHWPVSYGPCHWPKIVWLWRREGWCYTRLLDLVHLKLCSLLGKNNTFGNCIPPLIIAVIEGCGSEFCPAWPLACDHTSAQNGCCKEKCKSVRLWRQQHPIQVSKLRSYFCENLSWQKKNNHMISSILKLEKQFPTTVF